MVRVTTRGGETVDFLILSAGFGREGPGVLVETDRAEYAWTTPAGREAVAEGTPGDLSVDLSGTPSGRADRLVLQVSADAQLVVEADRPWIRLGLLAGGDPPGAALDHVMRGADRIRATGEGLARLFGDGLMAGEGARGRADVFELTGQGWRQAAGDFWLIPSTVYDVRMGDDDLRIESRGRIEIWGDAVSSLDKAGADGALIRGGDDRIDARDAQEGVRRPDPAALIGDVGTVGAGWSFRGGDDLLIAPRAAGAALTGDVLSGDRDSYLYCGDDELRGGRGDDILFGDAQDLLESFVSILPGADVLRGGRGADTLYGDLRGAGPDMLLIEPARNPGRSVGDDRIYGGAGRDRAEGGWGADRIFGGEGRDRLHGDAGADRIAGEGGADRLQGGGGRDRLDGGAEDDRLFGNGGADRIEGGAGADALHGGAGGDRARGGGGADRIEGDGGRDRLWGEGGRDRIDGEAGRDRLWGGGGRDRLDGAGGADRLEGGAGADVLRGGGDDDHLHGGGGRDRLFGGAGADVFRLQRGGGTDVVEDFDPDADWLSVQRALGEARVEDVGRGVAVSAGGASLLLLGVALEDLDPGVHHWLG